MSPSRTLPAALAAFAMLGAAACATVEDPHVAALEARVQRQEDVEAIRRLILDYGRFLDMRDIRSYADLFAADGELVVGNGTYEGREAIFEGISGAFGPSADVEWSSNFHILSNDVIDVGVDGDTDAAKAVTRWMFTRPGANGAPEIVLAGRYMDDFVRTPEGWRFQRREALNDMVMEGFP